MTLLSEFSYSDVSQRRIVLFNSLISFILLGYIYIYSSITLNYYFLYQPVLQIIFISACAGIFCGNLLAKILFKKFNNYKQIYLITEIIFIVSCLIFTYSKFITPGNYNPLLYLFSKNWFYAALPLFVISVFAGIKINYFLKIACGDFIDNKKAAMPFLLFLLSGTAAGFALSMILTYSNAHLFSGILPVAILPTAFLIKLSYNPAPIYAQEMKEKNNIPVQIKDNYKRDDLFFIYLNFTYILIYIFLGFTSIVKYFGDFIHVKIIFIIITFLSIALGIILARIIKQAFWYIYAEMLYPVFFIITLLCLISFKNGITFYAAVFIFIPVSVILGFSLFRTINYILLNNNHQNRFTIIDFSILILPAPILISLNFINFTYFWFFILLYIVALMNIFIPGIYLMQTSIKAYKKLLFFILSLIVIPLLILMHLYFGIPLNSKFFISYAAGFDGLNHINYNSQYIDNEVSVYTSGIPSFSAEDPSIRNMKRSIAPILLYINSKNWNEVLFIDGNQKFFKNPIISLFKNAICLDYLPDRMTDFKRLPIAGDQNYILENSEIITHLNKVKSPYKVIADIPNLFDQAVNAFRFSDEYYKIISNHLSAEGIFVQIVASNCRKSFLVSASNSLKKSFKKTICFYFPNYFVFMSANNIKTLEISQNNINNFREVFDSKNELKNIFYNEFHLLSHILFTELDDLLVYTSKDGINLSPFPRDSEKFIMDKNMIAGFYDNHSNFLNLVDKTNMNIYFYYSMQNQLSENRYFLPEVKKAELFEANKEYENEALQLINLKRQSEYKADLRKYIWDILSYKENYYFNAAQKFEKEKKWEDARKLYKAILTINKNNFEANYRLGILSIILQDIDSSFEYLQYAMILKKDDPKVFYQMGFLLFSSGRHREALIYFEKALELKEKTASLFYHIGLCHEELNNLPGALNYYSQAIILDPNDKNIISSIERVKEKTNQKQGETIDNEQNNSTEVEQGEDMPLPVTENAKTVRIEEDKAGPNKSKKDEKK
ncbi:MAG: tetratricopeptide repeat protein [Spirochaetota bacterium]